MSAASAIMQLEDLIKQASSLAQTFEGEMRFTIDQYSHLEGLCAKLLKAAENINASASAHRARAFQEAQKLLSVAQTDSKALFRTGQPKNLVTFKRNISLIFLGPSESSFDSLSNKRRKTVTKERCEKLSSLDPDSVILWSNALTPTMWTANEMSGDVFNYLATRIEKERVIQNWPPELFTTMHLLGQEGQLRTSEKYRDFLKASEARKHTAPQDPKGMQREADSSSALTNPPSIEGMSEIETASEARKHTGPQNPEGMQREADSSSALTNPPSMEGMSEIETAFLVPPAVFEEIWRSRDEWSSGHSIILTIPIENRIATIALSVPRLDAIFFGRKFSLHTIFRSTSS